MSKEISARELYLKLGLNESQWSRWAKRNIENNSFFKKEINWWYISLNETTEKGGHVARDFRIDDDFKIHIINSAKTISSKRKMEIIKELNLNNKIDVTSKHEIEFGETLEKFLKRWNVTIEKQYSILNYRIDFLVNGYIAVEYDEEHHNFQKEEDIIRMETINKYIEERFDGTHSLIWVRVEKGKEIEGLSEIVEKLIECESLDVWNGKIRFDNYNSESFGY